MVNRGAIQLDFGLEKTSDILLAVFYLKTFFQSRMLIFTRLQTKQPIVPTSWRIFSSQLGGLIYGNTQVYDAIANMGNSAD
jgi:hypothetical protein